MMIVQDSVKKFLHFEASQETEEMNVMHFATIVKDLSGDWFTEIACN